jgi:DNA-binding NtrC family response regulator
VGAYTILFIDDEPDVLRTLGNYFERLGHQVHRATSGKEGLDLFERVRPDIAVLDVAMPEMAGLDVLQVLRERNAMVIMLTGRSDIETAVEAMRLGAENFLVKPVDMPHLTEVIEKAAEKAVLRRENVALKRRLRPSMRRNVTRAALLLLLVLVSAGIGQAIGGGGAEAERPRSPIPVPLDSADTGSSPEAAPLIPFNSEGPP